MSRPEGRVGIRLVFVLATLVTVLAGCGQRFALKVVDAGAVPQAIRDEVVEKAKFDLVWHAVGEGDGYAFAACTYQAYVVDGKLGPCWEVAIALRGGDGVTRVLSDEYRQMPPKTTYLSTRGAGGRPVEGGEVCFIETSGLALTARAAKVVGITTAGTRRECPVRDGCWALALEGVAEGEYWSEVFAVDADRKVLHKYHEDWGQGVWVR